MDNTEKYQAQQKVFVLLADTSEGPWVSVHSSMDKAKAALQKSLDFNEDIQRIAAELGIEPLSADSYLNNRNEIHGDFLDTQDYYYIYEETVD